LDFRRKETLRTYILNLLKVARYIRGRELQMG
jgi:hypothetical protein